MISDLPDPLDPPVPPGHLGEEVASQERWRACLDKRERKATWEKQVPQVLEALLDLLGRWANRDSLVGQVCGAGREKWVLA